MGLMFLLSLLASCVGGVKVVDNYQLRSMPEGRLIEVSVSEQGMMAEPNYSYQVRLEADGTVSCVCYEHERSSYVKYSVGNQLLDSIREVIQEHKMYRYARSYYRTDVLDGTMWGFGARFDDAQSIYSGGSNAGPDDNGVSVIRTMCKEAVEQGVFLNLCDREGN